MSTSAFEGERIAKRIARAGVCSRRDAERLIAQGRVAIDGEVLESAARNVRPEEAVTVDGLPLPSSEPVRLFRLHKPEGVVTTAHDPQGRRTIYGLIGPEWPRLMPIGRLDLTSEGLLLLTNDGGLKRRLELPATGWLRRYRVRAYGRIEEAALAALANGIRIDGIDYGPIQARLDQRDGERSRSANVWLTMSLKEGKNREIRRVLEHQGLSVNRLIRTSYGPFQLGKLPPREIEEVTGKVLRDQLGRLLDGLAAPEPAQRRHRRA